MRTCLLFINQTGAIELGNASIMFAWCNNIVENDRIYQRIDYAIALPNWVSSLPKATVINLPIFTSDHNPILLKFNRFKEPIL